MTGAEKTQNFLPATSRSLSWSLTLLAGYLGDFLLSGLLSISI